MFIVTCGLDVDGLIKGSDVTMPLADLKGQVILYLVSEDWYFWSHRLPFARAARDRGAVIHVATRTTAHADRIRAEGFHLHPVPFDRSGLNPFKDIRTLLAIRRLYHAVQPDLVHHVALKPTLYGGLAALFSKNSVGSPTMVVNAMAGMGFMFISNSLKMRLLRPVVMGLFRFLTNRSGTRLIVQNRDDRSLFMEKMGVQPQQIAVIRGSGVDIEIFKPITRTNSQGETTLVETSRDETQRPVVIACVSRMLWDKGIGELVDATRLLKAEGCDPFVIQLIGPTDRNPASIPQETLDQWQDDGLVDVLGLQSDISKLYEAADIAVLPSYREGLPKSLLEGAAAGLPIVATDVPGCREVCVDGKTGLLVPEKDAAALARALKRLIDDPSLRQALGNAARAMVEDHFAEDIVVGETVALYRSILS